MYALTPLPYPSARSRTLFQHQITRSGPLHLPLSRGRGGRGVRLIARRGRRRRFLSRGSSGSSSGGGIRFGLRKAL